MNILVLNYEFPPIGGGGSYVSFDMCNMLIKNGHKVSVVTMGFDKLPSYEVMNGVEIFRVKCIRSKKNVCYPLEQLSYLVSAIVFLRKHLKNYRYDINHTHFIIPTGVISVWLKKKYDIPYVITAHGSDVIGHNKKRFKTLYSILKKPWQYIVKESKYVVAPSKYLLELMKSNQEEGNYVHIPNGVDSKLFHPLNKEKKILIMGRLQSTKAVDIILNALSGITLGDWSVEILGDGPEKDTLEVLSKTLNIDHKVKFLGWIEGRSERHVELLGKASIYITASRVENCPTSILEAMSSGCSIIASDIVSHRQMLEETEFLFEQDNIEELANLIIGAIKRNNSKEYDMEKWEWKTIIKRYEELFSS